MKLFPRCGAIFWVCAGIVARADTGLSFLIAPVSESLGENAPSVFIVVTEDQKFAVVAPSGWHASYRKGERLIKFQQGECVLTVRFLAADPANLNTEADWLKELSETYPGAEVTGRPICFSLGQQAIGFDLNWKHAGEFQRTGRFARVPMKSINLDFTLVCPMVQFESRLARLMQLMVTMRSAEPGDRVRLPTFEVE